MFCQFVVALLVVAFCWPFIGAVIVMAFELIASCLSVVLVIGGAYLLYHFLIGGKADE